MRAVISVIHPDILFRIQARYGRCQDSPHGLLQTSFASAQISLADFRLGVVDEVEEFIFIFCQGWIRTR